MAKSEPPRHSKTAPVAVQRPPLETKEFKAILKKWSEEPATIQREKAQPKFSGVVTKNADRILLEKLQQILNDHVKGLAIVSKNSTSFRRKSLTAQVVATTQLRLNKCKFPITVTIEDISESYRKGYVKISFAPNVRLGQLNRANDSLRFLQNVVMLKMSHSEAMGIKNGQKLTILGKILVAESPFDSLRFYYRNTCFSIREYNCSINAGTKKRLPDRYVP